MEGTRFGRYLLEQLVGEGGMGQVYRAHDTGTDRVVAVKVLHAHAAQDPVFRERFRREAKSAAGLGNPHVVPIYDYGEIEGRLFICMQYLDGVGVDALLARTGPMPAQQAVSIVAQAAEALDAAHAANLVHRDVKPSNLLVTANGFVYLIDFGIARMSGDKGLTTAGATIGTFAYMAPERFTSGTADARTDVYALTCVLFECLTGHIPYPATGMEQQIAGHLTLPPPQPSRQRAGLGTVFDDIIARGLAKDPTQRYQRATDLAAACTAALTASAVTVSPAPTLVADHDPNIGAVVPDRTRRRNPLPKGVPLAAAALVAAILGAATIYLVHDTGRAGSVSAGTLTTAPGTGVVTTSRTSDRAPTTTVAPVPVTTAAPNTVAPFGTAPVRLSTQYKGLSMCMDVVDRTDLADAAQLEPCDGSTRQQWTVVPVGSGWVRLHNNARGDGECLDTVGEDDQNRARLQPCGNYTGQFWRITLHPDGVYYEFTNEYRGTGLCLDVYGDTLAVHLSQCGAYSGEFWAASR
ncbi:serine/threonine protein kinase [Nocardia sp. NPDC059240]|uniref:serine/threonine protein kinase n=1 Tax=Nocardia sp. NPDC059240 TaxID=3346786 RepID=UPI00368CDA72